MKKTNILGGVVITSMLLSSLAYAAQNSDQNALQGKANFMENITFNKELTENGAIFTVSSDDPEIIEKIQNFDPSQMPKFPRHGGEMKDPDINFEKVNLQNGVELTITTDNEDKVSKIQNRAQNHPKAKDENIEENIELLSNGVRITITSDDPETVTKIQNHEPGKGPKGQAPDENQAEDLNP